MTFLKELTFCKYIFGLLIPLYFPPPLPMGPLFMTLKANRVQQRSTMKTIINYHSTHD